MNCVAICDCTGCSSWILIWNVYWGTSKFTSNLVQVQIGQSNQVDLRQMDSNTSQVQWMSDAIADVSLFGSRFTPAVRDEVWQLNLKWAKYWSSKKCLRMLPCVLFLSLRWCGWRRNMCVRETVFESSYFFVCPLFSRVFCERIKSIECNKNGPDPERERERERERLSFRL